jgi:CxxC motif-containing protein (DUF1111 family)
MRSSRSSHLSDGRAVPPTAENAAFELVAALVEGASNDDDVMLVRAARSRT